MTFFSFYDGTNSVVQQILKSELNLSMKGLTLPEPFFKRFFALNHNPSHFKHLALSIFPFSLPLTQIFVWIKQIIKRTLLHVTLINKSGF